MAARFTFLHLTDLHVGMEESGWIWPHMEAEVLDDLSRVVSDTGPIDAVFFTGDLTQRGSTEEFTAFDEVMERILGRLRDLNSEPVLLAVPGNHDLVRPNDHSAVMSSLRRFWEDAALRTGFWANETDEHRQAVRSAFASWTVWADRALSWGRLCDVRRSGVLPGDFLATWEGNGGLRIGLVGLNTAALQLTGEDHHGKLTVHPRQLAALERNVDDWCRGHDVCLLLTHHAPEWLHPTARGDFEAWIHKPERFVVHLCGHRHDPTRTTTSSGGALARRVWLGRSLFGREVVGERVDRLFGYTVGQIEFGATRTLRRAARADYKQQDGTYRLCPDQSERPNGMWAPEEDVGRSPRWPTSAIAIPSSPSSDALDRVAAWLEARASRTYARQGLLIVARLTGDGARPWRELIASLPSDSIHALVREAAEPADTDVDSVLASLTPQPPADLGGLLHTNLTARMEDAGQLLLQEDYDGAIHALEPLADQAQQAALATSAEQSTNFLRLRERARLNLAAALNRVERHDESVALLRSIQPELLNDRGRVNLGRFLVDAGELDLASSVVAGMAAAAAEVVHQLVAARRGSIPESPAEDADLLLTIAWHHQERRRSGDTIDFAERALRTGQLNERGRILVAELLAHALLGSWLGASTDSVVDPRSALSTLDQLVADRGQGADWSSVDPLHRACHRVDVDSTREPSADENAALPWTAELRAALSSHEPNSELKALADRWNVGEILFVAAVQLLDSRPDSALGLARRAFAILPGHGQRVLLARALLATGAVDEAREHIAALGPARTPDTWTLLIRAASEHGIGDPLEVCRAFRASDPEAVEPWVWEAQVHLERGDVPAARRSAEGARRWFDQLPTRALTVLAHAATAGTVDRELATAVLEAVSREQLRGDPHAEALRHHLLTATGAEAVRPIDWELLASTGMVTPVSEEQFEEIRRASRATAAAADDLYKTGALTFESWATLRSVPSGMAGVALRRGEPLPGVPPLPPEAPAPWRGRRCLLGALALEAMVAFGAHDAFGQEVGRLVLLSDTYERASRGGFDPVSVAFRAELEHTDAWRAPYALLPQREVSRDHPDLLTGDAVDALVAWLAEIGAIPRVSGPEPRVPPSSPVLDATAMLRLHTLGHSETFLAACRERGIVVSGDGWSSRALAFRRVELTLRLEAAGLAFELWSWLGRLRTEGKLEVVPVPAGPGLPPFRHAPPGVYDGMAERAFGARELLLSDPELVLVSSDLVEHGVGGFGPPTLLVERGWNRERFRQHASRYTETTTRTTTIAAVLRDLQLEDSDKVTGSLSRAGYVDAATAEDMQRWFVAYGGLLGEPHARLLGPVRMLADRRPLAFLPVFAPFIVRPLAEAIADSWLGDQVAHDAAALTTSVLEVVEAMDIHSHGRYRLVDLTLAMVLERSFRSSHRFVQAVGEVTAPDAPGQRLWEAVAMWADRPTRRAALQLAVDSLVRSLQSNLERPLVQVVVGSVLRWIPLNQHVDLSDPATAAVLNRRELAPLHRDYRIGPHSLAEWCEFGQRVADRAPFHDIELAFRVGAHTLFLPVEAVLPQLHPRAAELAEHTFARDGALSGAFSRWSAEASQEHELAVRTALDRSPLRAVQADPAVVLGWSRWAYPWTRGPRRASQLRQLLSEPEPAPHGGSWTNELNRRFAEGGVWSLPDAVGLFSQLARIPGATIGAASALVRTDGEELSELVHLLDDPGQLATGGLVDALIAIGKAGDQPHRRVGEVDVRLPELLARTAAAALHADGPRRDAIASYEPAVLRACALVVDAVCDTESLDPRERIWLSWRLFAWLTERIDQHPDRLDATLRIAAAAPDPRPEGECRGDLYDPWRAARGRVDHRELSILQALVEIRQRGAADWSLLTPTLIRIATRAYTPDERATRDDWLEASLGNRPLCAPDLARLLLLSIDGDVIDELSALQRMAWLDDALRPGDVDAPLRDVARPTLRAFAFRAARWSEAEVDRVHSAIRDQELPLDDPARALIGVATTGRVDDPILDERAEALVYAALGTAEGDELVAEWLLAVARRGVLQPAVDRLRAELVRRALPQGEVLRRLDRVLVGGARAEQDQGTEVLRRLTSDPHLASDPGLAALARERGISS